MTQPQRQHSVSMQEMLASAFKVTDTEFSKHIAKHWDKLEDPRVKAYFAEDADIPKTTFSQQHLANMLGEVHEKLQEHLKDAASADDVAEALAAFIDDEMEHLYFVSNNPTDARIAQDYFETLLDALGAGLKQMGAASNEDIETMQALREYYDVGFEGYCKLREMVADASGGNTQSMVTYALTQAMGTDMTKAKGFSKLVRMAETDENAAEMLHAMTYQAYNTLMREQPSMQEVDEHREFRYLDVWIQRSAMEVARDKMMQSMPSQYSKKENTAAMRSLMMHEVNTMNDAIALCMEHGEVAGTLLARDLFDDRRGELLDLPPHFRGIVEDSLVNAAIQANEGLTHALAENAQRRAEGGKPNSDRLGLMLWPHLDSSVHAQGVAHALNEYWEHELGAEASPQHLARKADMLLDDLAQDVFFATTNPALLLHAANYLGALRRGVGEELLEEGKFRPEDFAALKQVEEKCLHYYESFYETRKWLMLDTEGVYDRLGKQGYMKYAAESGRLYLDMEPNEWTQMVMPAARDDFAALLRNMNVTHKGCDHPLMPLIASKALSIASCEHGEPPKETPENMQATADYFEQVHARAREVLNEALDSLPKRHPLTGEKITAQPFTAADTAALMKKLDQHLRLVQVQGRAH